MSTPSIFELLRARLARGRGAPYDDGARIALAIEGGAMRGVISAGMVSGLEELGLTRAFDGVYGSSAGAINAAYFLAGQARLGTRIYYEDINTADFISFARTFRGRPVVNLGFLLDHVAAHRKRLDVQEVLSSPSSFTVIATDVERHTACALSGFDTASGLFSALRASSTMPVLAGHPCEHAGRRYLDASLSEPIPVPTAEADGYTHVLTLLTRSGVMRPHVSAFDRYYIAPRLRRLSPQLAHAYLTRAVPYSELIRAIDAGTGPLGRARVTTIRVADLAVSKLERRRAVLEAAAGRGRDAVLQAMRTL